MKYFITALLLSLTFSSSFLYASDADFMKNMAHANPVPNYMSIIKANEDKLGLNKQQKEKVMAWKNKHAKKMGAMVQSVIDGESEIKSASMAGASQTDIKAMSDKLMATRANIIAGKTTCRDYMMEVLTDVQWKQLTDIIKAA